MHCIGKNDKQQGKRMAWHNLTEVKEDLTLANCHLNPEAPGGWDIEETALYSDKGQPVIAETEIDEETGEVTRIYPWSVLRCTDNPAIIIGAPFNPATFKPVSNAQFLEIIEKSLEGTPYGVESVLSCCDRGRVAVSLTFPDLAKFKVGNREFEPFLSFGQGHDKSCPIYAVTSNICTVCNNTFTANMQHHGKLVNVRIKHTKNSADAITNVPEIIQAAIATQLEFAANFQALEAQEVSHSEAKAIFMGYLVGNVTDEELARKAEVDSNGVITREGFTVATRTLNRVDRLLAIFHDDEAGNSGRNLADVFSAVTDYYTHESAGGDDTWKAYLSGEFGAGNKVKQDFYKLVTCPDKLAEVKAMGQKILAAIR